MRQRHHFHASDEPVSPSRHSLDIKRIICRVGQNLAEALNRYVDAVVEFARRFVRPEPAANLVTQDDFASALQQHVEDFQRLLPDPDARAVLTQFSGARVKFERPEAIAQVAAAPR